MQKYRTAFFMLFFVFLSAAMPPTQQSDDPNDRLISDEIRAAIIANGNFSNDAQTIQIITRDRDVNLVGVVDSNRERKAVIQLANSVARVRKVYDNLIIAPK